MMVIFMFVSCANLTISKKIFCYVKCSVLCHDNNLFQIFRILVTLRLSNVSQTHYVYNNRTE